MHIPSFNIPKILFLKETLYDAYGYLEV